MFNQISNQLVPKYRRLLFERLGSERYSRPYRRGVGRKIETCLPQQGFFIEAGANDGFSESNTYYLERFRNWQGILIEPIPTLYQKCLQERSKSTVLNYALVDPDYKDPEIEMLYGHLMSVVSGVFGDGEQEKNHVEKAGRRLGFSPYKVKVPARTITSILDEYKVQEIDFFSLDVEGFEMQVLQGLNLEQYRPKYLLIECLTEPILNNVTAYLAKYYQTPEKLSEVDFWFQLIV